MKDKIKITILKDGTIKMDSDKISAPSHMNAEAFLRQIASLAGGVMKRVLKPGAKEHSHTHNGVTHTH